MKIRDKSEKGGKIMSYLNKYDLTGELWREYDFGGRVYRIDKPQAFFWALGHTCHRVLDLEGIIHCVPAPGVSGCVLRWKSRKKNSPVGF